MEEEGLEEEGLEEEGLEEEGLEEEGLEEEGLLVSPTNHITHHRLLLMKKNCNARHQPLGGGTAHDMYLLLCLPKRT